MCSKDIRYEEMHCTNHQYLLHDHSWKRMTVHSTHAAAIYIANTIRGKMQRFFLRKERILSIVDIALDQPKSNLTQDSAYVSLVSFTHFYAGCTKNAYL